MKKYFNSKQTLLLFFFCCFQLVVVAGENYEVLSPNGKLKIRLNINENISYEVIHNDISLITPSNISMTLEDGRIIGQGGTLKNTERNSVNGVIALVYGKNKTLQEDYNELKVNFEENYSLIVRAYDEGVAYRFVTSLGGDLIVRSEEANFNFAVNPSVWFPEADSKMESMERSYNSYPSIKHIYPTSFCVTPAMFWYTDNPVKIAITESDVSDYPALYLQRNGDSGMKGMWAQYPKTVTEPNNVYAYHRVTERYNYIARTSGNRTYPWRVIIVSDDDKQLLNNELVFKLAKPQAITNTDWIKPGKSIWEWWHDAILEGIDESGKSSFNLYKHYIDFASANRIEYLTMDANWSDTYAKQVCDYAATKNVKVFFWDFINLPVENPGRITQIKNYGGVGLKVDLIERNDQIAMNWVENLAKECADRNMMLLLHGCPTPMGLQRTYPNIVNFEAVRGAECNKWDYSCNADYHTQFIFIRMLAGPLDYTPGSMRNKHYEQFSPVSKGIPMSIGTRSHELAMYILFDQPLGYLCDSPVAYSKYPDIVNFFSKVPTVWDKTVPLAGAVGQYAVIAKNKGNEWYIGGMTNKNSRSVEIDFSFLPGMAAYKAEIYRDNEISDNDATAYTYETITINGHSKHTFHMEREGGFVIRVWDVPTTNISTVTTKEPKILTYTTLDKNYLHIQSDIDFQVVRITDIAGKVLCMEKTSGFKESEVNISHLGRGVYIATIQNNDKIYSSKFIK